MGCGATSQQQPIIHPNQAQPLEVVSPREIGK